jgi:hypothetical protein
VINAWNSKIQWDKCLNYWIVTAINFVPGTTIISYVSLHVYKSQKWKWTFPFPLYFLFIFCWMVKIISYLVFKIKISLLNRFDFKRLLESVFLLKTTQNFRPPSHQVCLNFTFNNFSATTQSKNVQYNS